MAELLIEFLSEEIPARMQRRAADDLERLLTDALAAENLDHDAVETFTTPRRLTVRVDGLPIEQPSRTIERKGPRTDAPEKAIEGFVGSIAIALDACEVREDKKGSFYMAVWEETGRPTRDVLPGIIAAIASDMPWPKSMRWAESSFRWVRPLHSILAILDGEPLAGELDKGDGVLAFSNTTAGHRFMAPADIAVAGFEDYRAKLRDAKVIVDPREREELIRAQMQKACGAEGLAEPEDDGLFAEVTGLVEWPMVLLGDIDPTFMELPPEVLVSSMREHQKYFALNDSGGAMVGKFAFVSNIEAKRPEAVVAGNERVLRARLSDAKYFWDLDLGTPLETMGQSLGGIVFHAKLGSVGDKIDRVEALAMWLAASIDDANPRTIARAVRLSKADLVSGMVGEFPELQGTMGRYYALAQGEPEDIADAVAQHYSPQGPGDACPTAPVSVSVALADKLDTLAGFWSIDEKPTGSKDPFALRRAALGVIRIVLENRIRLSLREAFAEARAHLGSEDRDLDDDLLRFFADRLKVHLRDDGVPHDHIEAVFEQQTDGDLFGIVDRVRALGAFLSSEDGNNLLVAYRRAANIVRAEEKKDSAEYDGADYDAVLAETEPDEKALWDALQLAETALENDLKTESFETAMTTLSGLRQPVDSFFDRVTVNVDDSSVRGNRLRLLARIQEVMNYVADFSKVEG
ncbi:MAG: glycine--tRNA ligase subunit beta [Alphaproteobacteria bacterium]|nr:glycine--tRNA ligase subunit beta [Alphaproteobacteria bacterium]